MISEEKKYHKVRLYSPWCMHKPKVSMRHTPDLLAPKLPLCGLVVFTRIYLQKEAGVSKHSRKKIIQLF